MRDVSAPGGTSAEQQNLSRAPGCSASQTDLSTVRSAFKKVKIGRSASQRAKTTAMALRQRCFLVLGLLMAVLGPIAAMRPALAPRRVVPTARSSSSPAVSRRAALAGLVLSTAPNMARAVDSKTKKELDEETARKYKAIYAAKSRIADPKQQEK